MTDIQSILTHRYPFLMIDRILDIELGKMARGYKNVTLNEWFFTESCKVMPSMMIVEALAQLGAFATSGKENGLGFLTSLKGIEFLGNALTPFFEKCSYWGVVYYMVCRCRIIHKKEAVTG